ncbi:MAG: hypothetical protein M1357_02305 [Candidatus Marsarchaeota archaeon]|nr:hypothetical protein [Candidatus Marsarchaeota archaeon]
MGASKKIADFYDAVASQLQPILGYVIVIALIAVLSGFIFVAVVSPPVEITSSSGSVVVIARGDASYELGAEAYLVAVITFFSSLGTLLLFRASGVVGEQRYANALAATGILLLIAALAGITFLGGYKL